MRETHTDMRNACVVLDSGWIRAERALGFGRAPPSALGPRSIVQAGIPAAVSVESRGTRAARHVQGRCVVSPHRRRGGFSGDADAAAGPLAAQTAMMPG